ncbi:TraM recognition domain-containing protein [Weissella paramesenteroides]
MVDMYVQDDVQVAKHYSESEAKEIMNNMLTQFHIQTKDRDTNQAVSDRLGEIEVQKEIVNSQMGEQQQDKGNRQVSIDKMPLLSAKELEELNDGEMVIMRTAKRNDKKWRRIRPLPIFDTGKTLMPNARDLIGQTYRLDYYTTDLRIKNNTKHLSYQDIFQDYSGYYQQLAAQVNPEKFVTDEDDKLTEQTQTIMPEPQNQTLADTTSNDKIGETNEVAESQETATNESNAADDDEVDDFTIWQREFSAQADEPLISKMEMSNWAFVQQVEDAIADALDTPAITADTDKVAVQADALAHKFFKRHEQLNQQAAMRDFMVDDDRCFNLLMTIAELRDAQEVEN